MAENRIGRRLPKGSKDETPFQEPLMLIRQIQTQISAKPSVLHCLLAVLESKLPPNPFGPHGAPERGYSGLDDRHLNES